MTARYAELLFAMALGAAYGWLESSWALACAGCVVGACVWLTWDGWHLHRVMQWLQRPEATREPRVPHAWRELVERFRKARKVLQSEVDDADTRLHEFLEAIQTSPNGVILLDHRERIEWCNQTAADQLGINPERDLMQHVTNLIREPMFTAYLHGGRYDQEIQIPGGRSSVSRPVVLAIRVHEYGYGRKLMLSRDVTAVQQAEAMRRDFVANVSHEIRTPLTVLSGFVETLQTLPLAPDERERYLGLMAQQANRMQSLVSDLLTLSKLEGSPSPNRQSRVSARELLDKCVVDAQGLSAALARGAHQFAEHVQADVWLLGNVDELTSAVGNLLGNAVRYTPGHGSISVGVRQLESGEVELWVSDTGPGVAPEHIPRLTERFYRVDRSRSRETGGTGLGLAIVKHVIQRHGGQLLIQSQLGAGSTFTLRFPPDRVRPL
ncbi:phosphate regulon sensor histidine kinase PhoR [Hydrogenophaga soli]|nr:phosphate regulon sensor histidine kinase PhoR [Burkholderiaceae bacterium]